MRVSIIAIILTIMLFGVNSCLKDDAPLKIAVNTVPTDLNDGWEVSTLQSENFDESKLQLAIDMFFDENDLPTSKGLLIARNGNIVLESYCRKLNDQNKLQNIKSVTKSITSIMTGIAIENNVLDTNLNRTVYSYIPEKFDGNLEKKTITLKHCLTMTTGLKDPVFVKSDEMITGNDHLATCLSVPLENTPGYDYKYNNGNANIIAGVIKKQSGENFGNYTKTHLFDKLGITNYNWVKWGDGEVNAAYDLMLLPRDMLKIGQFALQNGNWNAEQLLPLDWLYKSAQPYEHGSVDNYGLHWWVDANQNGYYAWGLGGQYIYVLPEKNLVIVHIAGTLHYPAEIERIPVLIDRIIDAVN